MDIEVLKNEIRSLGPWHHDIEVAPGVRTGSPELAANYSRSLGKPSVNDPIRDANALIQDLFSEGLQGRSFLDCACNAGGHSFAAKASGAGRVLGFDVREHWIRQAEFVARHLPSQGMDFRVGSLAELDEIAPGEMFDMTLFRGIFYHLPDPVAALKTVADRTAEMIVVNSSGKPGRTPGLVLSMESDVEVMSGVDQLAWLPTGPDVIQQILAWCGFAHSRVRFHWAAAPNGWSRMEVIAARDEQSFAHYDSIQHDITNYGKPAKLPLIDRVLRRIGL